MSAGGGASESPDSEPAPPRPAVDVRIAAERLLEDEALRNDLSDDGFAPILEVTLALMVRRQERFATTDSLAEAARSFVRAIVTIAESGDPSDLQLALASPLFLPAETHANLGADLCDRGDADARAGCIAERVAQACNLGSVQ